MGGGFTDPSLNMGREIISANVEGLNYDGAHNNHRTQSLPRYFFHPLEMPSYFVLNIIWVAGLRASIASPYVILSLISTLYYFRDLLVFNCLGGGRGRFQATPAFGQTSTFGQGSGMGFGGQAQQPSPFGNPSPTAFGGYRAIDGNA